MVRGYFSASLSLAALGAKAVRDKNEAFSVPPELGRCRQLGNSLKFDRQWGGDYVVR